MLLRHPAKAVVFDMDGLLFDTESLYGQAILRAAQELGCDMSLEVFYRFVGTPWHSNRRLMIEQYGESYPADALRDAWMRHFGILVEAGLELKPGAIELLDLLDTLGLPRAIATSSSHETVRHHLDRHRLARRFHAVVAAGDYLNSKPAADPFLRAAERLGVEPRQCLALEDSHNGVRSASAAGMMTVMVPDLVAPTDEIRRLCAVVHSLHDVSAALRSISPATMLEAK
jgi:HAD superfamily hydrolase (TIGR01509 family)